MKVRSLGSHSKHATQMALLVEVSLATTTAAQATLLAPASLTATAISTSAGKLSWIDTNSKESSYSIERSLSATSGWVVIAALSRNVTSYQDGGLRSSTAYYYRVRATSHGQTSPYSNVASATTYSATTATPIVTRTATPVATATRTATPVATATPVTTATRTATPVATATRTPTPAATPASPPGVAMWKRQLGGTWQDLGAAVAVDASGNMIVVGSFSTTANFAGTPLTSAGAGDVFVAKYTAAGVPMWAQRFGSVSNDTAYGVAVDRSLDPTTQQPKNDIIVVGNFGGTVTIGTTSLTSAGGADIFVAKYSAAGAALWAQRFGNSGDDVANGVAVDAAGNVLVTGSFFSQTDFGGGMLYSQYYDEDTFVAKFSPSGGYLWARNFWNASADRGQAIAVDGNGDVFVAGTYNGLMNLSGTMLGSPGPSDGYVAKLSGVNGSGVWSRAFGAMLGDAAYGVAVDGSGNVLVTGTFDGSVNFGTAPYVSAGNDAFVAKYSGSGTPLWSKDIGGTPKNKRGNSVAVDTLGNVLVTGFTDGTAD